MVLHHGGRGGERRAPKEPFRGKRRRRWEQLQSKTGASLERKKGTNKSQKPLVQERPCLKRGARK